MVLGSDKGRMALNFRSLLAGLVVLAVLGSTCAAANVNRPDAIQTGSEGAAASSEVTPKSSPDHHEDEVTVEDAPESTDASKPFFYAAKAKDSAEVKKPETEDDPSEDELNKMMDEVVGEIMMADDLEGRSGHSLRNAYVPEYMQGMVGQLGGYSMAVQSPYPDFSLPPPHVMPHPFYPPPPPGLCPPCPCQDEHHYQDEHDYNEEDEYEEKDVTVPYGFVFDPTVSYDGKSRHRRSTDDDDYWHNIGDASKFLAKHNVGFRIKNDLRERLEDDRDPLHSGHIYTGGVQSKNIHDRPFGHDADFNLYEDLPAFKLKPHGPRLGKRWVWKGYPIYAYNLYKLRAPLKAESLTHHGYGDKVWIKPGVYKFVAILDDLAGLLVEDAKTGDRFVLEGIMIDMHKLSKFQALVPFKDPNGKYVSVENPFLGKAFLVKGTPLTGNSPKVKSDLLQHGYSGFKHLVSGQNHGGLINTHNVVHGTPDFSFD